MTRPNLELAQCHTQSKSGRTTCRILGYGEDVATLWALKHRLSDILQRFKDQTAPSDCLVFYRPSFGRRGGKDRAEFGEFDAIVASPESIYLIESRWDNLKKSRKPKISLRPEQRTRHRLFSWYLIHWNKKYATAWEIFVRDQMDSFRKEFPRKRLAPPHSLLASNLEFILARIQVRCAHAHLTRSNIKNVLLFFHNQNRSIPPTNINSGFNLVPIDYNQEIESNFIALD